MNDFKPRNPETLEEWHNAIDFLFNHPHTPRKLKEVLARQSGVGNVDEKYDQSFGHSERELAY